MDTSFSVPPPGYPLAPPAARAQPVGDLKRLDSRRVRARLLDAALLLPIAVVAGVTQEESLYIPHLLVTLIYFFLAEATGAQTVGKRKLGLRVMRRDGSAPSVNQISVRTVLRLIDDGPIGLGAMVLSGKRRQRIGDLLAGTTVGPARGPVPRPASSPLLVAYPVGWFVAAIVWFFAGAGGALDEERYRAAFQEICRDTRAAGATPSTLAEWLPHLQAQHDAHAALTPPASLRRAHGQLLAIEQSDLEAGRQLLAAQANRDTGGARAAVKRAFAVLERRAHVARAAGLPDCA